jgi:uncharacterized membrane protein SpoIIM required for sporulation
MRVVDRLAQREASWRELDALLDKLASPRRIRPGTADVLRLGELYRAACTDLMLAEAHDLPRDTVAYLHALVGRAHNAVYRAQGFRFSDWGKSLFGTVPRRLRTDPALRLAAVVFWGSFLIFGLLAAGRPDFANEILGEPLVEQVKHMYSEPLSKTGKGGEKVSRERNDAFMTGFYIQNNTSIGLKCFAWGLFFGIGSVLMLLENGIRLGTVFGHMAVTPHWRNFYTFVTAHGPFELTAIVFAGAAGLRLGYGMILALGQMSFAPLRREAANALPTVGASAVLFVLAAFLEGFVSASPLPYSAKAAIAFVCAGLIVVYLALGGRGGAVAEGERAEGRVPVGDVPSFARPAFAPAAAATEG